jgi:hypothetical protein
MVKTVANAQKQDIIEIRCDNLYSGPVSNRSLFLSANAIDMY